MANRKQILKVVRELNKIMGLEPRIDTKADTEVIVPLILEASEWIEPDDEISEETLEVIQELITESEENEIEDEVENDVDEEENKVDIEEDELENKDEIEELNEENKKNEITEETKEKTQPKNKSKKPTKKENQINRITWMTAMIQVLKELKGQTVSSGTILDNMCNLYDSINTNKKMNREGARTTWDLHKRLLVQLEIVARNKNLWTIL